MTMNYATDHVATAQAEMKLAGVWAQAGRMPVLDNSYSLAGWRVHRVDSVVQAVGGATVMDMVAMTTPLTFATLGDLRERIGRMWSTKAKDPQRAVCR